MPKISQAKKDARRDQILSAAMRLFARQGFQATTMPEICAEAGLSVGAVYSYFSGKDAIIAALVEAGRRGTADLAADARQEGSPEARLEALLRELERPGREILNQVDVRWLAEAIGDRGMREGYRQAYAGLTAELTKLLEPGTRGAAAPEGLAELVAAAMVGLQVRKAILPKADLSPALDALLGLLKPTRSAE
jgi:AcrR family transcriptional regulator